METDIFTKNIPATTTPFDPVGFARDFAMVAHRDQKYGDKPYVVHLDRVARNVRDYSPRKGDEKNLFPVCAYLHDVLEDTAITKQTLEIMFGHIVAGICESLTRQEGEQYFDFIKRIKPLDYVRAVKAADVQANLTQSLTDVKPSLVQRYEKALDILDVKTIKRHPY